MRSEFGDTSYNPITYFYLRYIGPVSFKSCVHKCAHILHTICLFFFSFFLFIISVLFVLPNDTTYPLTFSWFDRNSRSPPSQNSCLHRLADFFAFSSFSLYVLNVALCFLIYLCRLWCRMCVFWLSMTSRRGTKFIVFFYIQEYHRPRKSRHICRVPIV